MASKSQSGRVAPSQRRQRRTSLTRDQLALIHVARRDRHLEEDEYRHLLKEAAGVESAKELDAAGFTKVLNRFKSIGFIHSPGPGSAPPKDPAPAYGQRRGMASDAQVTLIRSLWARWDAEDDERALNHWLSRSYGVAALRFATVHIAHLAIQGLRAMVARRTAPAAPEGPAVPSEALAGGPTPDRI